MPVLPSGLVFTFRPSMIAFSGLAQIPCDAGEFALVLPAHRHRRFEPRALVVRGDRVVLPARVPRTLEEALPLFQVSRIGPGFEVIRDDETLADLLDGRLNERDTEAVRRWLRRAYVRDFLRDTVDTAERASAAQAEMRRKLHGRPSRA